MYTGKPCKNWVQCWRWGEVHSVGTVVVGAWSAYYRSQIPASEQRHWTSRIANAKFLILSQYLGQQSVPHQAEGSYASAAFPFFGHIPRYQIHCTRGAPRQTAEPLVRLPTFWPPAFLCGLSLTETVFCSIVKPNVWTAAARSGQDRQI